MRFRYTPEMLEFLRCGYLQMQVPELARAFNAAFGLTKTPREIKACLSNHRFVCGRHPGNPKGSSLLFNTAQVAFIHEHYTTLSRRKLTSALNEAFGTDFTPEQILGFVKNHGIQSGRTGRFEKGAVPHNAGVAGWQAGGRSAETQFKAGRPAHEARNYLPIGSTRISKDGYLERKVTDDPGLVPARRWVAEHRLVWEAINGPIPKGHVVVFLDADKANIAPDNLRCVSRSVVQYMNKMGLNGSSGEARKAAILTSEIMAAIHKKAAA